MNIASSDSPKKNLYPFCVSFHHIKDHDFINFILGSHKYTLLQINCIELEIPSTTILSGSVAVLDLLQLNLY